jgi:hypothetical protein
MNYRAKLAAAVNDYQLGLKIAASPLWDAVRSEYGVYGPAVGGVFDTRTPTAFEALKNLFNDGNLGNAAREHVGDIANRHPNLLKVLGAGAGVGAVGGAVGGGIAHAIKQHKRNQLLKRVGMGAGGAALLGGGGLLAHHLMSDDE